jgi:D-alanine--poly(phosphoribitol) ligase subunit 2
MNTADTVLGILAEVTQHDAVRRDLDLALYEKHVIDSLGTVELIVALSRELDLELSPADLDRAMWATPRKIIADVERRLALVRSAG